MKKIIGIILSLLIFFFIFMNNFLININFRKILNLKVYFEGGEFKKKENIIIDTPLFFNNKDSSILIFEQNLKKIKRLEFSNFKIGKNFIASFFPEQNKITFQDKKYFNSYDFYSKENLIIKPDSDVFIELFRNYMEINIYRYNVFNFMPENIIKYSSDSLIISYNFNDNLVSLGLLDGRNIFIDVLNKKIYEYKKNGISIASNITIYGNYSVFINRIDDKNIFYLYDVEKGKEFYKELEAKGDNCNIFCMFDDYFLSSDNEKIEVYIIENDVLVQKNIVNSTIKIVDLKWEDRYSFGVGINNYASYLIIYDKEQNDICFIKWKYAIRYIDIIENGKYLVVYGIDRFWIFEID